MGDLELGSSASQARQGPGQQLLLRSASRLPVGFPKRRSRFRAWFRDFVRVPASPCQRDGVRQGDLRGDGGLLDKLREEGRPQRTGVPAWPSYDSMYFSRTAYVGPVPSLE